jgi:hypothetical protein
VQRGVTELVGLDRGDDTFEVGQDGGQVGVGLLCAHIDEVADADPSSD